MDLVPTQTRGFLDEESPKGIVPVPTGNLLARSSAGVSFLSYPTEWPAEMLHEAGLFLLDLSEAVLEEGLTLGEACPWSVGFQGTRAFLKNEEALQARHPNDGTWPCFEQFLKTFIYPLLADRELGMPAHHVFLANRGGLDPETVYRMAGWGRRLHQPFLSLVSVPTWLRRRFTPKKRRFTGDAKRARFAQRSLLRHLRGVLSRVAPLAERHAPWGGYQAIASEILAREKEAFLTTFLDNVKPARLLDLGAGSGRYSTLAASRGTEVVAVDRNPVVGGKLWRRARMGRLPILPLVMDITNPSPGLGWNNEGTVAFRDRAVGGFDGVIAFGLLPHLWIEEGISLESTVDWLHGLRAPWILAEHAGPGDPTVEHLRGARSPALDRGHFEQACRSRGFAVSDAKLLSGGDRCVFLLERQIP